MPEQLLTQAKQIICALLATILPFLGIGRPEVGAQAPTDPEVTRVMSFNVRCGEFDREQIVPQLVADYLPDSVGLQECEGTWYLTMLANLPDYGIVGVGRLTGIKLIGESTAIMYRKDKYKLIDSGTFWLSETPYMVSKGWDAAYHRTCTWVVLENLETGAQYAHVNTHLDNKGAQAREKGLEMVLEKAKSFENMPVFITGDFNFLKGTGPYNFINDYGFFDTQDIAEDTMAGKTSHDYNGGEAGNPIDFVCVNGLIDKVKTYRIVRDQIDSRYVSDHYPVYADIVLK